MENKYTSSDFFSRELSWLKFCYRVLKQAQDNTNPLLEKIKFLAILTSNLDEFFKVRVASLKVQADQNINNLDISGLLPQKHLDEIKKEVSSLVKTQYEYYSVLSESLKDEVNIHIKKFDTLTDKEKVYIDNYFRDIIFPILTPMAVDAYRPFPNLNAGQLHLVVNVKERNGINFSFLEIPSVIDRIVKLPGEELHFILLEDIIKHNLLNIFYGYEILSYGLFRITRNEDTTIEDENISEDLLMEVEKEIRARRWGETVRIEYTKETPKHYLEFLSEKLESNNIDFYEIDGPLNLNFLWKISNINSSDNLKFPPNIPKFNPDFKDDEVFSILKNQNLILRHPFDSFEYIINFINAAANDPKVLAIKQTLYRVSGNSSVIKALIQAANNGKQVSVVVELKARFDEANNVKWARELEKSGCHVIYGLSGLKTHCKALLVIRKEDEGIKRYVHLGTGNYNDSTAKLYVDTSFFTSDQEIGIDISNLFNKLTGFSKIDNWKKLLVAPQYLRNELYFLIDREIKNAKLKKKAKIFVKANGLTDKKIIEKLYDASKAGVEIILLIRGACCLKSGIKNLSENIKVYSIVGRFLEHDRIIFFENNGKHEYYLGSADWMTRNLSERVELMFPIENKDDQKKIQSIINNCLKDNVKLSIQNPDGTYTKVPKKKNSKSFNVQEYYRELT